MLSISNLKISDFFKLHRSYDSLGSKKYFIDLYWLGLAKRSLKWYFAQISIFGSTIPVVKELIKLIYFKAAVISVVAYDGPSIIGYCFLVYREKISRNKYLAEYGIWVTEKSRGKGVGKLLTQHIINLAKESGDIESIRLFVWENNPEARKLYENMGFVEKRVIQDDKEVDGVRYDSVEMQLNINNDVVTDKALFIATGIDENNPGIAGGETRFIEIAKGWKESGVDIHLLSTKGGPYLCQKFGLEVTPHYIKSIDNGGRIEFLIKALHSFKIPGTLNGFSHGILYSTNEQLYDVLPALVLKLRHPRLKWGVVVHWLPPFKWWTRKQTTNLNSVLFLLSERLSLYIGCVFADRILAVSESTKTQIKNDIFAKFFIKKVSAVECGVDINEITEFSDNVAKEYDAVFLKRLQAVKGIFDLIDIWERVVKKLPNAKLIVIGAGIDGEEAKDRVKKRHLDNNITFVGPVFDMKRKIEMLAASRIFILPTYEENWAIVIGESMAAGVPVFSYDLKELKDVWKDNFYGIPVGNIDLFAEKIIEFLNDPQRLTEMSLKGKEFIKQYDWKKISLNELKQVRNA